MLSKGTVSGAASTYEIAPAVKMQDLVDYFTTFDGAQPRMGTTVFMFLMNKAKYESLPADLEESDRRQFRPQACTLRNPSLGT